MQSKYEMINSRWCTKKDVLQDLAMANGRKVTNLDNNFFIVGESPPPPLMFNDEEAKMFHANNFLRTNDDNAMKPDLRGITQMLRLVKEHSESKESVDNVSMGNSSPKSFCDIISISKLNPNVKEFVPRCATLTLMGESKDDAIEDIQAGDNCVGSNKAQISDRKSSEDNLNKIPIENLVTISFLDENKQSEETNVNKQAIATVLKNKITRINASQKKTFQAKNERNVALANLQKLYSIQPNENVSFDAERPVKKVIKLITPDFFEKSKAAKVIDISKNELEMNTKQLNKESIDANCQACPLNLQNTSAEKVKNGKIKDENTHSDSEANSCTLKSNASDPQIQDSIKKVKNWFSKENKKPRAPAVYLGPVSFKRKDLTNRQSPNEIVKKLSKPNLTITKQYIPTKYASELNKMYVERMKNKEMKTEKVSWDNLNMKLIEKDEEMKGKAKHLVSCSSSSTESIPKSDTENKNILVKLTTERWGQKS